MEHAGAGALQAAFERLKARLLAEGLFDASRKKPLPEQVSHLGVVTSPTGAAIHDILTVLQRRCPAIEVSILPVAVQGEGAAAEIVSAIERANRLHAEGRVHLDALIVGRGGGSLEDLWAFNEEIVARAIAASALPIVSAVGHEVDFSIADMVADQRAPTPSAAAEMLSPDRREQLARLEKLEADLVRLMRRKLADAQTRLDHLRQCLKHPGALLREQSQRLDDLEQRLVLAQRNLLARKRGELALLESRLRANSPLPRIEQLQRDLQGLQQRLEGAMQAKLDNARRELAHLAQMLDSLSPLATLQRGYAIVSDDKGRVVTAAEQVHVGQTLQARLARGMIDVTVTSSIPEDD
jgi:exodeoxyribonuclease VII large subunit